MKMMENILVPFSRILFFPPKMTGIDIEKSQNYNEPVRKLHESSFVEIVA
ncbi:hypothetical protein T11_12271 [Trichinella zimbabwensis]|uniref:Uncharacterized protein n=1 Tax=Trichinella zimbabwensis TaxID=268475 RepID=A0A0V1GHX7_9BILA|nr:hypothetical protein T11_12271 [Trichinella zimbabwensis]